MGSPRKKPIRTKRPPPAPTPKAKKEWDAPAAPAKGDARDSATFQAIGNALSQWEHFEAYFGILFGVFVGTPDFTDPAMRAYGSILTFRGRVEMMEAASEAYFLRFPDETMRKRFGDLANLATKLATRRNEIAHGIVQPYFPDGQNQAGYALVPSYHATNRRSIGPASAGIAPYASTPNYAYSSQEIEILREKFGELAGRCMTLYRDVISSRTALQNRQKREELVRRLIDRRQSTVESEVTNPENQKE